MSRDPFFIDTSVVNVVDKTENGHCSRCGECCADFLPVTKGEFDAVVAYVEKNKIKPYNNGVMAINQPMIDLTCPLFNAIEKKCMVYPVRPEICRTFQCNRNVSVLQSEKDSYYSDGKHEVHCFRDEIFHQGMSTLILQRLSE